MSISWALPLPESKAMWLRQGRNYSKLQGKQVQRSRNLKDLKAILKLLTIYNTVHLACRNIKIVTVSYDKSK